jgi:hypothetical protein
MGVTVVFPEQFCFAAHHADGSFMTRFGAQPTSIALPFVDFDYLP